MQPVELSPLRIRLDMTLKVHILAVLNVLRRQRGAQPEGNYRGICRRGCNKDIELVSVQQGDLLFLSGGLMQGVKPIPHKFTITITRRLFHRNRSSVHTCTKQQNYTLVLHFWITFSTQQEAAAIPLKMPFLITFPQRPPPRWWCLSNEYLISLVSSSQSRRRHYTRNKFNNTTVSAMTSSAALYPHPSLGFRRRIVLSSSPITMIIWLLTPIMLSLESLWNVFHL